MSGPFDDERPRWPERDLDRDRPYDPPPPDPEPDPAPEPEPEPDPAPPPETEASEPTTTLGDPPDPDGWDTRRDGDRRRPTTAEQAVPWLIGVVLALSGIVVVLLALIFVGPEGVAGVPTPSPSASAPEPTATPTPVPPTPSPTVGPTASPPPVFGALDMTYLGHSTAASPIRLLRHDFSTSAASAVILDDPGGVAHYAWAPDGRRGVAIVAGKAVAVVEGQPARTLTNPVDAVIFGEDSSTLYGLRVTRDGANDRAEVLTIDFTSGATQILTTVSYPHPQIVADPKLKEAQFADDGGITRLYVTVDGYVVAWILGAPATYQVDPESGASTQIDHKPVLWSPDQRSRIDLAVKSSVTTITLFDDAGAAQASVKVTGLVSHVRWAGSDNEIVFTLGRIIGSGVHQDLYVWDLVDGKAAAPLTSNGASFGAEWLGVLQAWKS
ncbi:MAG: hypothetical protein ACXWWU_02580 [Candidatus Limnocylindria bacterium]